MKFNKQRAWLYVGLFLLSLCLMFGCGAPSFGVSAATAPSNETDREGPAQYQRVKIAPWIYRTVDTEQGVVCYIYRRQGGISCVEITR